MFIYFLLLQPVLDILAYVNIPFSSLLRGTAIFAGLAYLLFLAPVKSRKSLFVYLTLLGLFFASHFLINFMTKTPFNVSPELMYSIKTIFFIVMLLVYAAVIKSRSKQPNWQHNMQLVVVINITFIAAIMLIANLTETGHKSYGSVAKAGHSGWFFSANELSVILGMGFGIVILYMMEKRSRWLEMFPLAALVIWAMLTAGTKVSAGSVFVVLGVSILIFVIKAFRTRKYWLNAISLSILLAATIAVAPSTPIGHNLNLDFGISQDSVSKQSPEPEESITSERLLSGREDFLKARQTQYNEASISQKLVGMGYGGNDTDDPKLIEMDFFDWYLSYGLIGFLLLISPLSFIGYRIVIKLFTHQLHILNTTNVLLITSVCLGLGSAFIAGHVLSSPGVSIYLAFLIGYLHTLAVKVD